MEKCYKKVPKKEYECTYELYELIYAKWRKLNCSPRELACMQWPYTLSLKRIRNIAYAGHKKALRIHEAAIYKVFRIKFLELKDIPKAVEWCYEHQPQRYVSERTIRRAIAKLHKS